MATDEARLLVRIEAQLRQFERQMAKATGTSNTTATRIERRFKTMERNLATTGVGLARSLLGPIAALASAREVVMAADAFTRIQNALRVVGLEGEEAASVLDRIAQSAEKNGAPMEALVNVYRAGALAQKELNVTSEELVRFSGSIAAALRVAGKSAGESRGALIQLAQAIGAGIVRAEEFNAILEGALPIAQAAARGIAEAGGSVAKLRTLIIDGEVSSQAFFRGIEAGSAQLEELAATADLTLGQSLENLRTRLILAVGQLDTATGGSKRLAVALDGVGDALEGVIDWLIRSAPAFDRAGSAISEMFSNIARDARMLGRTLGAQTLGENAGFTDPINNMIRDVFDNVDASNEATALFDKSTDELEKALIRRAVLQGGDLVAGPKAGEKPAAVVEPISLEDFPVTGGKTSKTKTPAQKFGDDISRIQERTAALRIEATLINATTLERERALAVLDLENEAKRAGLSITPQLTAQIRAEAEAYAQAAMAMETAEERQQAINDLQQAFGNIAIDSIEGLIDGSKTLNDVLDDTLKTLLRMVLQASLLGEGPLAGFLGTKNPSGGVGGFFGRLFSGGGSSPAATFGGLYASGGTLGAGKWGIAGESGPEIIHGPAGITPMGAANVNMKVINAYGPEADVSARQSGPGGRDIEIFVDRRVEEKIGRMAGQKSGRAVGLRAPMVQR